MKQMIMNMSIEKMLSHVYEIEGLMLVTRRLGEENTPDIISNKIQRKVRELAEMCGVTCAPAQPASEPVEPAEPAAPAEISEISEPLPDDEENEPDITVEFIEAPDEAPVVDDEPAPAVEPPAAPAVEPPAAHAAVPPAPPVTVQPPVFRPPVEAFDEPVPEPDPEVVPEAVVEPDAPVDYEAGEDEFVPEPEDEMPMPPVPTDFPEIDEAPAGPLRVDEKLQRSLSQDIRKAFSLNDRFRFQRELFAGSANALDTAIEHIEAMTSYGNAELYFFSQLHWDRDNEVVKDFMTIVRNHFQK